MKVISNAKTKNEYKKVVEMLAEKLKAERYNGVYFDRSQKDTHKLCTEDGWFSCQVLWFIHMICDFSFSSAKPICL